MRLSARTITLLLLLIITRQQIQAQKFNAKDMTLTAHGWWGTDMERTRPNLKTYGYMTYEAAIGLQTNPNDSSAYAQRFGYPMFNFGFSLARMENFKFIDQTKLPNLYSLYGSFERSLLRRKHISLGYLLDFGVTYNPDKYDPVNNPGNNWLSSPVMAYFGAGAFIKFHIGKRWEIGADAMFRHYSNGRLTLPNEALNALGGGIFARYRISDYDYKDYLGKPRLKADYKRGMQYMIVLGGGVHTCMAEWNAKVETEKDPAQKSKIKLKAHPKFSISLDAMYRYSLRYASGISLDVFYSSNMKELEASDRIVYGDEEVDKSPGYSPISIGIALVHEVYWHNFAVHVAVGAYPYRHKGVNGEAAKELGDRERGWHYEKAGLRYYFPKLGDTFLGFAIKSHSIKAEYLEFSVGVRI
ncbi:MAG: acyloxyacyl hydrolase [Bacteroidaceae bacterium]|nr:acyloxyacyl hydrolase [Bacteroidaceae bacterium]